MNKTIQRKGAERAEKEQEKYMLNNFKFFSSYSMLFALLRSKISLSYKPL